MLAEFVNAISEKALAAKQARVVDLAGKEPAHVYALQLPGGEVTFRQSQQQPLDAIAADLQAILDFANDHRETSEIWYSRGGIETFLDRSTRRDKIGFALEESVQVSLLNRWSKSNGEWMKQEALLKLMRTVFYGCLGAAGDIVNILRKVKFVNNVAGESTIERGKASIGRSIEQEVTGMGVLPETITFEVPMFANVFTSMRGRITCALEVDTANQTFALITLPQQVENALVECESLIGDMIRQQINGGRETGLVPVYYGDHS